MNSISGDEAAGNITLIAAHSSFEVSGIPSGSSQLFQNKSGDIGLSDVGSRTCDE